MNSPMNGRKVSTQENYLSEPKKKKKLEGKRKE